MNSSYPKIGPCLFLEELVMVSNTEVEIFEREILGAVGKSTSRWLPSSVTGFLAMRGHEYKGDLMVVGRAVNDWGTGIKPSDLGAPDQARLYAVSVRESVSGNDKCPMLWVTRPPKDKSDYKPNKKPYNPNRSAFWRTIKKVVGELGIADTEEQNWPSHLVWSNLYKVSPKNGGNPGITLCKVQHRGCVELLRRELKIYQPKRVLFLTGADWMEPTWGEPSFIPNGMHATNGSHKFVVSVGEYAGARCVVAVHPQGKKEQEWSDEVIAAFRAK